MGNFKKVSMGNGVLKWKGVDIGFLKGDVNYKYNYSVEDFKTGVPNALRGSITKEITAELTAPVAELSTANIAMALGGLPISTTGSPVTISAGAPSIRTFSPWMGGQAIILDGPNPTSVVIKSNDNVTTYTVDTDYFVVPGVAGSTAMVFRNPTGTIPSLATVRATYGYTQAAGSQIDLGVQFSLEQGDLEFVHTNPTTKLKKTVKFWKATSNGQFDINFAESSFIINTITFKGIFDEMHPLNPLGYFHDEEEAA